jgi:hypothetical protein
MDAFFRRRGRKDYGSELECGLGRSVHGWHRFVCIYESLHNLIDDYSNGAEKQNVSDIHRQLEVINRFIARAYFCLFCKYDTVYTRVLHFSSLMLGLFLET